MAFFIGLLTLVLVLDCVVLVLLVLIQLPKKDAGAGLAFGGGATDALFGAGTGNVLTKITKYTATIFFVLALVLSIMQSSFHRRTSSEFEKGLQQPGRPLAAPAPAPATPGPTITPSAPVTGSNTLLSVPTAAEATNAPAAPTATPPAAGTNATKK
jgi:preprotein translocase subunit SecG